MPTLLNFLRKINIDASIFLDEPLSLHTSFGIGGPAEALVRPRDSRSLTRLVHEARAGGIPLFFLGGGANILVGDGGLRGLVVDLGLLRGLGREELPDGRTRVVAEAGLSITQLCETALAWGLGGLENFYGMPGSLGGSVFMNARCYEIELADRLEAVSFLDARGEVGSLARKPEDWSYKHSPFQEGAAKEGALVLGASFLLSRAPRGELLDLMLARRNDRLAKGHYRLPSAGSVFKNDRSLGRPSGKILDELGLRGRRIGDAMISEWHANIFVNAGRARARDMLALVELAREEARRRAGVELEPEIRFVGEN